MKLYLYNILIGIDQFANVVLGGSPDETISTRVYRHREHWAAGASVKFIDFLFSWHEKDHCKSSYESGDRQTEEVWK